MSRYIWADLKDHKLADEVVSKTQYWSPARLHNEVWSWNTSRAIDALEDVLQLDPQRYDADKNEVVGGVTKKKLGDLLYLWYIAKEVIIRLDNIEELMALYMQDEDKASDFWYEQVSYLTYPGEYEADDLSKYNDIDDPEIAAAVRKADLEFRDKKHAETVENRQHFLTRMNNVCVANGDDDLRVLECLTGSVDEFIAFITLADTIHTLEQCGANDETEIVFSVS